MKVIVVGGGWAGISSSYELSKQGIETILIERTDLLLGTGLSGGIMYNNGRYTILEELRAMGIDTLITTIDNNLVHKNITFPDHNHASTYDINKMETLIKKLLLKQGVKIILKERISKVNIKKNKIISVVSDNQVEYFGEAFIDTTGTFGPMNNCLKYGNGCVMCLLRCPSFKGRVSLTNLCGLKEKTLLKNDGTIGAMSGSCDINKDSVSKTIIKEIEKKGSLIIPLKKDLIDDHLNIKACQQYSSYEYKNNLIILDTGSLKLMMPYYNLEKLHNVKGFENAKYNIPLSGGIGNSMRFFAIAPYNLKMKVKKIKNLFCAGEKTGLIGHTEAILTGVLAGYNACQKIKNEPLLELPRTTCCGETIYYTCQKIKTKTGLTKKYTASGSILFNHLQKKQLYIFEKQKIKNNIEKLKLENIF